MIKLFERIFWHNNTTPAINEDNLNAMSKAIDDIDNRVIDLGADVMEVVPQIQAYLDQAADLVEAMELLTKNPPYIGANGNWYVWDTETSSFVDSGIDASITVQIADVTMLNYGTAPYITNTGTNTDPIFHLFIPRAAGITSITKTGTSGLVDTYTVTFQDGNTSTFQVTNGKGIVSIAKTSTSGLVDTYTITFNDSTTTTFTVTNGNGDMNKSTYDPQSAVENAGGIPNYVSGAVSSLKSALTNNINLNGCKNLLPNEIYSQTIGNVTITVYDDLSFKANGTANANIDLPLFPTGTTLNVPEGDYVLSSGSNLPSGVYLSIQHNVSGWKDITNGNSSINVSFASGQYISKGHFYIANGTTVSDLMVYPMLCLESDWDNDSTYEPYAKTNKELTDEVSSLKSAFTNNVSFADAKNLYSFDTYTQSTNGVLFTVNDDLTITTANTSGNGNIVFLVGTVAKGLTKAHLSGCPSGGSHDTYALQLKDMTTNTFLSEEVGAGRDYTLDATHEYNIYIIVRASQNMNGKIFKPMITLDTTPDSDYDHYVAPSKTNRQLTEDSVTWDDFSEVGAVNLLKNIATSQTVNEVTYTVNADKSITATFSSVPAASRNLDVCGAFTIDKPMKLTGCPSGGGDGIHRLYTYNSGTNTYYRDEGDGILIPAGNYSYVRAVVGANESASASPLTFYPMLSLPDYNGPYVPYAKTNKELTDIANKLLFGGTGVSVSAVTDLNTLLTSQGDVSFNVSRFLNNTTNAPYAGGGLVFTWVSSASYGAQLVLGNGGFWFRDNTQYTISAWQKIST